LRTGAEGCAEQRISINADNHDRLQKVVAGLDADGPLVIADQEQHAQTQLAATPPLQASGHPRPP